ncbi:hypothetical protein Tcan_03351 [Toxocara canis]|uniref:Uncharacterized protein n=1 Tax=Toxocara canis TaxID=6265 RepID=A0A0B2VYS0_TOXCA|nr:hypothetical protein Tcan_03351 [Toxocara canis]
MNCFWDAFISIAEHDVQWLDFVRKMWCVCAFQIMQMCSHCTYNANVFLRSFENGRNIDRSHGCFSNTHWPHSLVHFAHFWEAYDRGHSLQASLTDTSPEGTQRYGITDKLWSLPKTVKKETKSLENPSK